MLEIWSRDYLLNNGENLDNQLKCYKYFVAAKQKGLLGFKTKAAAKKYVFGLNKNVILYFNDIGQCWNVDQAEGYIKRRVVDKEYLPGGYNIFGEQLNGRTIDVIEERLVYKCGISLFNCKDLEMAHNFIKNNNLILILNIH